MRFGGMDESMEWSGAHLRVILTRPAAITPCYPILDMFNVFDRHDVREKDRPARWQAFREQMRGDVRRRIG